jgi:hypothetical protein
MSCISVTESFTSQITDPQTQYFSSASDQANKIALIYYKLFQIRILLLNHINLKFSMFKLQI